MKQYGLDDESRQSLARAVIEVTGKDRLAATAVIGMCRRSLPTFIGRTQEEDERILRGVIARRYKLILPQKVRPELWRSPIGRRMVGEIMTDNLRAEKKKSR